MTAGLKVWFRQKHQLFSLNEDTDDIVVKFQST